jgi:hypothetical protein
MAFGMKAHSLLFHPSFLKIFPEFPFRFLGTLFLSNNPKGRVPRALPVGEWELAQRASSIACVLKRVPRALPVGIYILIDRSPDELSNR